jgi:hypothetical protein
MREVNDIYIMKTINHYRKNINEDIRRYRHPYYGSAEPILQK